MTVLRLHAPGGTGTLFLQLGLPQIYGNVCIKVLQNSQVATGLIVISIRQCQNGLMLMEIGGRTGSESEPGVNDSQVMVLPHNCTVFLLRARPPYMSDNVTSSERTTYIYTYIYTHMGGQWSSD